MQMFLADICEQNEAFAANSGITMTVQALDSVWEVLFEVLLILGMFLF